VNSNERLCSKCHAGYGYDNKDFDFQNQNNIDCVVCHDNTGTYQKSKPEKGVKLSGSGYPATGIDLNNVAQHVGYPQKNNCGSCHFFGGGGNNVKHGDLEKAQLHCTRELDVHMASKGKNPPNLICQDCHQTEHHNITGHLYTVASSASNRTTCVQCHTDKPHQSKLLNSHFKTVACQTCHIPVYAKGAPTKIIWDWSTATRMGKDRKPVTGMDLPGSTYVFEGKTYENVKIHFDSKHGTGVFQQNVAPEYVWFNGTANHHLLQDTIGDTTHALILNPLFGSYQDHIKPTDPENPTKIWPVKVMRGKQPYDPVNGLLINPKLVGSRSSGALWADYDWEASARKGMEYIGLPYSGQYAFMKTESMWLLNHEVAPADQALQCAECHNNTNSKLSSLTGFYLPGRDKSLLLDNAGLVFVILVLMGVSIHGILRVVNNKRRK
jgi:octaheme c-type cytochrome (tetrathionate reductase family)